jgi:hypothetical protein
MRQGQDDVSPAGLRVEGIVPRQNRVTPLGEIVAVPERGNFLGNRGCLHDDAGRIRRDWQLERWIVCVLRFKGRHRRVMKPGHYTELFFLDEATAFAAGHRPCAECRRERFNAFRQCLAAAHRGKKTPHSAVEIDARLHADRLTADGAKRLEPAELDALPDGAFVQLPGRGEIPYLVWGNELFAWSAGGYTARIERPRGLEVPVLTPVLTVLALRGGYVPELHPSARVPTQGEQQ